MEKLLLGKWSFVFFMTLVSFVFVGNVSALDYDSRSQWELYNTSKWFGEQIWETGRDTNGLFSRYNVSSGEWGIDNNITRITTASAWNRLYYLTGNTTYKDNFIDSIDYALTNLWTNETLAKYNLTSKSAQTDWSLNVGYDLGAQIFLLIEAYRLTNNNTYLTYAQDIANRLKITGYNQTYKLNYFGITPSDLSVNILSDEDGTNSKYHQAKSGLAAGIAIRAIGNYSNNSTLSDWGDDAINAIWILRFASSGILSDRYDPDTNTTTSAQTPSDVYTDEFLAFWWPAYELTDDWFFNTFEQDVVRPFIQYYWNETHDYFYTSVARNPSVIKPTLLQSRQQTEVIEAMAYLYYTTGNSTYLDYAEKVWNTMKKISNNNNGYFPLFWNVTTDTLEPGEDDRAYIAAHSRYMRSSALLYRMTRNVTYYNEVFIQHDILVSNFSQSYSLKGFVNDINSTSDIITNHEIGADINPLSGYLGALYWLAIHSENVLLNETETIRPVAAGGFGNIPTIINGTINPQNGNISFSVNSSVQQWIEYIVIPKGYANMVVVNLTISSGVTNIRTTAYNETSTNKLIVDFNNTLSCLCQIKLPSPTGNIFLELNTTDLKIDINTSALINLTIDLLDRKTTINNNGTTRIIFSPSSDSINITAYSWTTAYKKWNESADNTSVTVTHTICDNPETTKMRLKILNTPSGTIYRYKNTNGNGCFTYTYTLGYANGTVTYILTTPGGPNLAVAAVGGTGISLLILYLYGLRRRRR